MLRRAKTIRSVAFADKPAERKHFLFTLYGEDMKKSQTVWIKPWNMLGAMALLSLAAGSHAVEISDGLDGAPIAEIREELKSVPPDIRANMSREQVSRFISNMLIDRRMEKAALAAGTADLPEVRAGIARASRNVVVRAFADAEAKKLAQTLPDLDGLAKERYEVNKASYVIPEAIRVAHILLTVNVENPESSDEVVRAKAERLLAELRDGADFGELAQKHSEDRGSSRSKGELPGWSEKGKLVPPFEEAAYALKPGEVSGLVRTRFGYHIIKLLEKREARQQTFEEVKESIVSALRNEFLGSKRAEWNKAFLGNKPIVLDDATLEALKKP
ncbi:MAG: peptidylprolyl isomerase [Thiobacillus sp.]|nr:peptidylprolyl isomerase [Thiobacillus sp.]